jgi:hypothetical protein
LAQKIPTKLSEEKSIIEFKLEKEILKLSNFLAQKIPTKLSEEKSMFGRCVICPVKGEALTKFVFVIFSRQLEQFGTGPSCVLCDH